MRATQRIQISSRVVDGSDGRGSAYRRRSLPQLPISESAPRESRTEACPKFAWLQPPKTFRSILQRRSEAGGKDAERKSISDCETFALRRIDLREIRRVSCK